MNNRKIAYEIIYKTINDDAYTNLLMRNKLNELDKKERPFVTNLVNMVLKNYDYLICQVNEYIDNKTPLKNKVILAMAIYEKFYLKEKDFVVNNEYVKLANNKYDKAFINAILRKDIQLKNAKEDYINCSLPKWLYELLNKQYTAIEFKKIIDNFHRIPNVYYRINHHKVKFGDLDNIEIINDDLFIYKDRLLNIDYIEKGYAYIQDYNSSSLYKNFNWHNDDLLLDICSAPGSKLFNCLDIIKPENAYANEIHEKRLNLIKNKAKILGYDNIHYLNYDGRLLKDNLDIKFDKIMLDVPCSGIGTIGRKPDLKYHIKPENLDELEIIQRELLDSCIPLLKDNGEILYSTCTLNKKENNKQIINFINRHQEFYLLKEETIINDYGDCFYYALLVKGYNKEDEFNI